MGHPKDRSQRPLEGLVTAPADSDSIPAVVEEAPAAAPTREGFSTILGSVERSGDWFVSDRLRVRCILGNIKLDLREADLPADDIVEIDCDVILGDFELIVPPGTEVDMTRVHPVLSTLKQQSVRERVRPFLRRLVTGVERGRPDDTPEEPLLIVLRGTVLLGNLSVKAK